MNGLDLAHYYPEGYDTNGVGCKDIWYVVDHVLWVSFLLVLIIFLLQQLFIRPSWKDNVKHVINELCSASFQCRS